MSTVETWRLLRQLLDPDSTNSAFKQQLERLAHQFDGTKKELLEEVRNRYINPAGSEPLPDYGAGKNSELDAPISLAEVRARINRLRTKSAAGPDSVSNRMLRNIEDGSIANLAAYMQEC